MNILSYHLPDQILLHDQTSRYRSMVWQPPQECIVLGNSNQIAEAVWEDAINRDSIPIIKRPTGGQTVLLSPKMLVVSAIQNLENIGSSRQYFSFYNKKIISVLEKFNTKKLEIRGISDITVGERKIVGSAMYRNPQHIFFHAVINVAEESARIGRYLKMPSVVPEYRQGRNHLEFVTSLVEQGFSSTIQELQSELQKEMNIFF